MLYIVYTSIKMAQYSEGGSGPGANDYASLPDYYSSVPLMGTGVTVTQLDPSNRPFLSSARVVNTKAADPVFRSGYATLSGAQSQVQMKNTGENLSVNNSDYFSLAAAYKTR
jgi:hypothetical protein